MFKTSCLATGMTFCQSIQAASSVLAGDNYTLILYGKLRSFRDCAINEFWTLSIQERRQRSRSARGAVLEEVRLIDSQAGVIDNKCLVTGKINYTQCQIMDENDGETLFL